MTDIKLLFLILLTANIVCLVGVFPNPVFILNMLAIILSLYKVLE